MKLRKLYRDDIDQELLRRKSLEVILPLSSKDQETIEYLLFYIKQSQIPNNPYNFSPGVGLASPQIGILKRMIAVYIEDHDMAQQYQMINPKIIERSARQSYIEEGEGCLSVTTDFEGYAIRNAIVTISYIDYPTLEKRTLKARGYLAIVLQHEIDHLDGILYYDRINKLDPFQKIDNALVINLLPKISEN